MRYLSLGGILLCFWLLLSGHYTIFLISLGILSAALCVVIARAKELADIEGHPVHLLPGALTYFPWLIFEIIKATLDVTKVILNPKLPITPNLLTVKASQKTPLGVNIYGNSITLTPGTITVEATGNTLKVHALTEASGAELASGAMDVRVTAFEGEQ